MTEKEINKSNPDKKIDNAREKLKEEFKKIQELGGISSIIEEEIKNTLETTEEE